tara:strand:+ start:4408 stop:5175 length:768 start_codon:yes stop_codon:yes gene_type:complete
MEKTCIIKQPAGIGDILFCQKIAKIIQQETEYKKVIWPVSEQYAYLNDYLVSDGIEFPNVNENFPLKEVYLQKNFYMIEEKNYLYVPLDYSSYVLTKCSCHNNPRAHGHIKYNYCEASYENWEDYFSIIRNFEKEDGLIKKLGLNDNEPFNLINSNCGTYPNHLTTHRIKPNNSYKNVEMSFQEGYTIFDWMGVFERAKEIHTMECGVYYILQKLKLDNVFIYSKYTSEWDDGMNRTDDFSYMKDHCNQNWSYIN